MVTLRSTTASRPRARRLGLALLALAAVGSAALAAPPFVAPDAPTNLFVDSSDASTGTAGNPVVAIDTSPVFSCIVTTPGSAPADVYIQVATDIGFSNLLWDSGWLDVSATPSGNRISDQTYNGSALSSDTRYFWRAKVRNTESEESGWNAVTASFFTGATNFDAMLATINTIPWTPNEATEATVWIANFPQTGLTASGSAFQHATIVDPRRGSSGSGDQAWANQPDMNYADSTVAWLHSPIFDLDTEVPDGCGLQLRFEVWSRNEIGNDGMKLQVSTNGGTSWSDVNPTSPIYNGTAASLTTPFGGSADCWYGAVDGSNDLGDGDAELCIIDLEPYAGESDVRFRFCFASNSTTNAEGPVLDGFRMLRTAEGVTPMYQGQASTITITGTGFTGASALAFTDSAVSVSNFSVVNDTTITATATVGQLAVAGRTCFTITQSPANIEGTALVVRPTDLLPSPDDSEPYQNAAMGGVGVALVNGEFIQTVTDHATRGRMHGITWTRTHQSGCTYNGPLGHKWTGFYFQRAIFDSGTSDITWHTPEGRTEVFDWDGSEYDPPAGVYWTATRDSQTGEITLRHKHGHTCVFEGTDGRLITCTDRHGNDVLLQHNAVGQLVTITDDRLNHWDIEYYDHGRVRYLKDYVWNATTPRVIEFGYSSAGDLTSVKLPETDRYNDTAGTRITHECTYDSSHRLLTCKAPNEVAGSGAAYLTNVYESGKVIQQTLGTSGQNLYVRYPSATLVRVVDRRGLRTDFTLDSSGRATAVAQYTKFWSVDTQGQINHNTITETSGKVRSTDPDSFTTNYTFNSDHEVTAITYPRGNSVEFTYQTVVSDPDVRGNVTEVRRKDNALGAESDLVTSATYTSSHQLLATSTDARGEVTTYSRDSSGNVTSTVLPTVDLGQPAAQSITITATYTSYGQLDTRTDGEGFVTDYVYFTTGNQNGFLKQVIVDTATLDLTTEFDTNRAGDVIAQWPPRAFAAGATKDDFKTSIEVNELGQAWHVTGPIEFVGGSARSEVYRYFDANGNLVQEFREYIKPDGTQPSAPSDPDDPSTFSKSSTAMAATWVETTHTYNILNHRTKTEVDAVAGTPVTRVDTEFGFDANYNQTSVTSPLGNVTATSYDERDLVFQVSAGDGSAVEGTYQTDYDANGNVVTQTDALGNDTTLVLDGFDRVTTATDGELHYVTQTYDANSNPLVTEHFNSGNTSLAKTTQYFDELNRVWKTERVAKDKDGTNIGDGLDTTTTLHDKNSRVTKVTDDNAVDTTFTYDGANRRTATVDELLNEVNPTYNLDGAVTETEYVEQNPITQGEEVSHTEAVLDLRNRRVAWRDQRYDATNRDTQVDYSLDGWGRVVTITDAASVETAYEYDLLSRKTKTTRKPTTTGSTWIITRHVWDSDSRLTDNKISTDGSAETSYQVTSYGYDARHRRTFVHLPDYSGTGSEPFDGEWEFSYDVQSNLTGVEDPLGTSWADTFDGRNLIEGRTITRASGVKGATREAYVFDGLGRLTTATNYETRSMTEYTLVAQTWAYNTLSHAESHNQKVYDHNGNLLGPAGGYTTTATFDALGLTKTTGHALGLSLAHSYDGLNRLSSTAISGGGATLATYTYAGPSRLIKRVYDNGIVTKVDYESSGCGCGGFSGWVESVKHERSASDDTPVFRSERRYDVLGNVTVERWGHRGGVGDVYRYDDTYRLEDTYQGVDLSGTNLATYANPSNTPSAYLQRRNYALDTRGNRTSVVDKDDSATPVTLRTVSYTADSNTNEYTAVDGQSFTFDNREQMTFDPTTGLYTAYDYAGQRVAVDGNSDFSSPERWYVHDAHRRLRLEERWNGSTPVSAEVYTYMPELGSPPVVADQVGQVGSGSTFIESDDDVAYVTGMGAAGGGGCGGATNPWTATRLPSGGTIGSFVILERATDGVTTEERWISENALGSTLGVTDTNGAAVREYLATDYGSTASLHVEYDSADATVTNMANNGSFTRLTLAMGASSPTGLEGHLVRVVTNDGAGLLYSGCIVNVGSGVVDCTPQGANPGTVSARLLVFEPSDPNLALLDDTSTFSNHASIALSWSAGQWTLTDTSANFTGKANYAWRVELDFGGTDTQIWVGKIVSVTDATHAVVTMPADVSTGSPPGANFYNLYSAGVSAGGHGGLWAASPTFNGGTYTQLYAQVPVAGSWTGWRVCVEAATPQFFDITNVSGRILEVKGDVRTLVTKGAPYAVLPPVGADPSTAALYTSTLGTDARSVWAGYFHISPVVEASGDNLAGEEHAWNRVYLTGTDGQFGRWGTQDPASRPWTNLQSYCPRPVSGADLSGLDYSYRKFDRIEWEQRRERWGPYFVQYGSTCMLQYAYVSWLQLKVWYTEWYVITTQRQSGAAKWFEVAGVGLGGIAAATFKVPPVAAAAGVLGAGSLLIGALIEAAQPVVKEEHLQVGSSYEVRYTDFQVDRWQTERTWRCGPWTGWGHEPSPTWYDNRFREWYPGAGSGVPTPSPDARGTPTTSEGTCHKRNEQDDDPKSPWNDPAGRGTVQ